ncbi:recombinase RecA [Candidatus Dependentiae bacterium]
MTTSQTSKDKKKDARPERMKALDAAFAQIQKQFGQGSVMLFGQLPKTKIATISTGSVFIDNALGVGGFPCGRIVEVFGPEASGKTTVALHAIAEAQKNGGVCAFIDAEHAMDTSYASSVGVNVDDLVISQPDYGEQALDIAEMLIRSGAIDLLVIDSVAALVPKAEIDGDMGDIQVGLQARLMSKALRKLTSIVHKSKTVLIFINQIRSKINTLPFANKETTSGGNALKFYSSVRLDIRKIATLKKGDKPVGNRLSVKIVKNKVAPPFARVEVDLIFGKGICKYREVLELAMNNGIIKQAGAWFSHEGTKIAQGRDKLLKKLEQEQEFFKLITGEIDKKTNQETGE